jgi:hypothetical protein
MWLGTAWKLKHKIISSWNFPFNTFKPWLSVGKKPQNKTADMVASFLCVCIFFPLRWMVLWFGCGLSHKGSCVESLVPSMMRWEWDPGWFLPEGWYTYKTSPSWSLASCQCVISPCIHSHFMLSALMDVVKVSLPVASLMEPLIVDFKYPELWSRAYFLYILPSLGHFILAKEIGQREMEQLDPMVDIGFSNVIVLFYLPTSNVWVSSVCSSIFVINF